ncbi:MAG: tRNA-specific 2-thiouridylase MnmA [bacterium ADurb.Bin212]|nr:MAG: tRNA-specific 2-thiouridylase MnmA [bacterium ADurb.Bin212]
MIHNSKIKVAVALSGGVDSAAVAKILKDEGYDVIGLFLKMWKHDGVDDGLLESRKVAEFLKIPFYEIDAEAEFKRVVVEYFVSEYKNLRTPNPCTICNPEIKFKLLIGEAEKLGCAKLATGHYARIKDSETTNNQGAITNKYPNSNYSNKKQFNNTTIYHLLAGFDNSKDQSYMLYRLNQEQLSKVIFPLGELTKKEVRELAKKWDLPVAEKKESQEICFLQNTDYREFLKNEVKDSCIESGDIVDTGGNIVGRHEGLINYTIGQRRGINQQLKNRETKELKNVNTVIPSDSQVLREAEESLYDKKPLYVAGFDRSKNRLIVGEDSEIYKKEMVVSNLSWINVPTHYPLPATNLSVKIRSQAKSVGCKIKNSGLRIKQGTIKVIFDEPQRAVTPGQSAVFFIGDEVIGGGTIEK